MEETNYKIEISGNGRDIAKFSGEFGRINVILGGNGTGKSKLINQLKAHINSFGGTRPLIYVEGGRTVNIPNSLQRTNQDFNNYRTFEQTETNYKQKRNNTLTARIKDALILLEQTEQEINNKYSKEAHEWNLNGRITAFPIKPTAPLDKLFELFNEVFPSITLTFNSGNKSLRCHKNGNDYHPSQLSDGEKQIFCLLADIVVLAESNSLILVDEPELNLNPGLACRFWDIVEAELPNAVFIYATHCVSFAMRKSVDRIAVLSKNPDNNTFIKNIGELNSGELYELLGAIPAILSSNSALAVEGKENSFDQLFYRWLIQSNDLEVIPVGSSANVKNMANKKGIWEKIAPSVKINGVIDSDFKSDNELNNGEDNNTLTLQYHEVESYFCDPKLVCELANKLSVLDPLPNEDEIAEFIIKEFESQINTISAQRTFSRGNIRLGVSLEKKVLSSIDTVDELKDAIAKGAELEKAKAESIGKEQMLKILDEELSKCQKALDDKSIPEILKLIPGKQLLNKLAPKAGCRSERNFANAVKKHIDIKDYPHLSELKTELTKKFE
ncbi:ATP-dependent endonuclease [Psychroserpens sp. XS_ASV72]|uniref:ATP-dependent nuclease n=1 Tax=Psychroserpens sp. XS_ASV72 TaxID=3241293 RepID=UPI00351438C2